MAITPIIINFNHVFQVSFASDARPDIPYWLFQTLTGLTGLALYSLMCVIYMFAHPVVRKKAYRYVVTGHRFV